MKNNFKRILSMILVVVTVVGCCAFPVSATAPVAQSTCDHEGWKKVSTIAPTCDTQGYELWYCEDCYIYEQREVTPKTDHDWKMMEEAKAPTCSADGYPAGSVVCAKCGEYDVAVNGALPSAYAQKTTCGAACTALGAGKHDVESDECIHTWGDPHSEGDPCLDPTQKITYECKYCDAKVEETNTTGKHVYEYYYGKDENGKDQFKAPTCYSEGFVTRKCTVCKNAQKQNVVIEKVPHTWAPDDTKADATNCGKICTVKECQKVEKDTTATHTFKTTKDDKVTCLTDGVKIETCDNCGYEKTTKTSAHGHDYKNRGYKDYSNNPVTRVEVVAKRVPEVHTKEQQTPAVYTYKCTVCEVEYTEKGAAIQHVPDTSTETTIPATCVEPGFKVYQCTVCMLIVKDDIPAKGHNKNGVTGGKPFVADPPTYTCEDGGYYSYKCSCGTVWVDDENPIKKGAHDWIKNGADVAPACGVDGWDGALCSLCGAKNGHKVNMTGAHVPTVLFTYGDGCVVNKIVYKYCKCACTAGCAYYDKALVDEITTMKNNNSSPDDIKAKLEIAATAGKVWRDDQGKLGYHDIGEETVIVRPTCKTSGWKGSICLNCGKEYKTEPVYVSDFNDYHNHEGEQQILIFRWSCDAESGEELYSKYHCLACNKDYDAPSFIPKNGINLVVGTNGLTSIQIYVDGVCVDKMENTGETFAIAGNDIAKAEFDANNELVAGTQHVWKETTGATCNSVAVFTCVICADTKDGETVGHEADKVTVANGGKYDVTLDPTCATEGIWESECKWCGEPMSDKIPATGNHDYTAQVKCTDPDCDHKDVTKCTYGKSNATCTTPDTYYKSCTVCKASSKGVKNKEATFTDGTTIPHVYDQKFTCNVKNCKHTDQTKCKYKNVSYLKSTNTNCQTKAVYYYACACGASSKDETDTTHEQYQATYTHGDFGECPKSKGAGYTAQYACLEFSYDHTTECTLCDTVYVWHGFTAATGHVAKDYTGKQEPYVAVAGQTNPVPGTGEQPYVAPSCVMLGYWYTECKECGQYKDENGFFFDIIINDGTVAKNNGTDDKYPASVNAPHVNFGDQILTGNCKYVIDDIAGHNKYECKNCEGIIEPQHDYEEVATECGDRTCTICGDVLEADDAAHNYVKDENATTEEGVVVEVCDVCGKVKETIIPAVTFSMEIANPNGSDIVNGGKAYLTIKMNCVNATMHSVYLELTAPTHLVSAKLVEVGALGGNVQVAQKRTTVSIFADAGTEREEVTVNGDAILCVIEFNVNYDAWIDATKHIENNVVDSSISFVEPADTNEVMVINYAGEDVAFDVAENKTLEFNINQIGDIDNDGVINSQDALVLYQAIKNKAEYNAVLDVNNDGKVNELDYGRVMQYIVGLKSYEDLVENN